MDEIFRYVGISLETRFCRKSIINYFIHPSPFYLFQGSYIFILRSSVTAIAAAAAVGALRVKT